LILLGLGLASLAIENIFYQYLDDEGFLHESMFMPLGFLSIFSGTIILLFFIIKYLILKIKNKIPTDKD
jgi:hypothetical protein